MAYEVRPLEDDDRVHIDILLSADYALSGYPDKPRLSNEQYERWKKVAVAAFNADNIPEAVALAGSWKYGDAAPYSRLPRKLLKGFARAGLLYRGDTGIFVMSAKAYEEGTALSALVDETGILEPKTGAVRVPLLRSEVDARHFLEGREFRAGRAGLDHLSGVDEPVETVLMTRRKKR